MNSIMTVEDSFLVKGKGIVVSGANKRFDSMQEADVIPTHRTGNGSF